MEKQIKLSDGTELIPLDKEEKDALEKDIKVVLDKYNAMYLPVIKKEESLSQITQTAALFLLKKKEIGIPSTNPEVNPIIKNGEDTNKIEDNTNSETKEGGLGDSQESAEK